MSSVIFTDREGPHAVLTLNRPDKLNALSYEPIDELMIHLDTIESDASVRAVILTGSGDKALAPEPTSQALLLTSRQRRRMRIAISYTAVRT